jgi:helicase
MWRPSRILWEEKGKWKPILEAPNLQEILLKTKRIFLDVRLSEREKKGIRGFCRDFNITTIIQEHRLCPFCLIYDQITLLSEKKNYLVYGREVCRPCAIQELEKDLEHKKVSLLKSPGFKKYALTLLDRLHEIQRITTLFTSEETTIGDFTLIQKINEKSSMIFKHSNGNISDLKLPSLLLNALSLCNIDTLLPIQFKSIQAGLLRNKNQLIIANTSAGKTLIGEIAGINHIEKYNKKMIFTVPLVALANTKFTDFKKKYGSKLNIGLRTGRARIFSSVKEKKAFYRDRYYIKDSDIIVATYEGLDLLIRAGQLNFDDIGCIIIDEVQTLSDLERGPTLDCLIAKIRSYAKNAQIIGLSATIGNTQQFAKNLFLDLVSLDHRPIPLEQHMLISHSPHHKMRQIHKLVQKEYQLTSNTGFRGQTIVFTNSRRKTGEIMDFLRHSGIKKARAYHSGLSYPFRFQIESEFANGKCPVVVSTYALGAGVDFPASQVIFESLLMGRSIIDANTFTQMSGRAGRLGKHDRGRVVLLCSGETVSSFDSRSEIELAFELIKADLLDIEPNYDEDSCSEQILSICSTTQFMTPSNAKAIYQIMIGTRDFDFMHLTNKMIKASLIQINIRGNQRELQLTPLGKAATLSFFSPSKVVAITSLLRDKKHFLSIALEMIQIQNIYLSKKLHSYLEKTYHMRFSTRLINSPVLDVMTASLKGKEATELNKWCLTVFSKWTQNFFSCACIENPYCQHPQELIGRFLVTERLEGKNIDQISAKISQYELLIYPGDVLSFLNGIIHELEGIARITKALGLNKLEKKINLLIGKIELPNR